MKSDEAMEKLANEHATRVAHRFVEGKFVETSEPFIDPDSRDDFIAGWRARPAKDPLWREVRDTLSDCLQRGGIAGEVKEKTLALLAKLDEAMKEGKG